MSYKKIGQILIEHHLITQAHLDEALARQQQYGGKLGLIFLDMGLLEEETLFDLLAKQLKVDYVDLKFFELDPELVRKLPETLARRFRAIVLEDDDIEYKIGMPEPQDLYAYDQISLQLKRPIFPVLVREKYLVEAVDRIYRKSDEISSFAGELSQEIGKVSPETKAQKVAFSAEDAPVEKLLNSLLTDALQARASDIHIEPSEDVLRIRQRVDGVLHEHLMNETEIAPALSQRLKMLAGLNIAERRLPQDGRFHYQVHNQDLDVRLSTLPTNYGESVVMRLLNQSSSLIGLDQLGMPASVENDLRKIINRPHGMLLVTGPTGSGKTTTLYSVLKELNVADKKIITVEDPVEYRLDRITQVQINSKIGLDFATVLRSTLRQDPDILMVGEIRDQETASIALRASMTGHFVFATLHTNDAISSAMRLVDMGAEGYLVATALKGVLAQRLVRKVCGSCAVPYEPSAQEMSWIKTFHNNDQALANLRKGNGCSHCHQTGYQGRIGAYELLELDDAMLAALRENDTNQFIQAAKNSERYRPLGLRTFDLALQGVTTIDEVLRIAGELEEENNHG